MAAPWVTLLDLIRNGEGVSAEVTNRPLIELGQRTEHLKALLDMLSLGRATFDIDKPMSVDVVEGYAVYWDNTKQEYAPALAALSYNAEGLYGGNADSAYVVGVCAGKSSPTRGTVLFSGSSEDIDFSSAIEGGGTLGAGPYFLSAVEPGRMTRVRPAVGIYVMFGQGTEGAIIAPSPREVLEDHIHYRIPLKYGSTIDGSGGIGWTASFDVSLAPTGARYRYVVESDAALYSLFPMYPPSSVYFELEGIGANEKVVIDLNGIWWVDVDHNPDEYNYQVLYYARSTQCTSNLLVRTIQPWTMDSPLKVVNIRGETANAGDVYLQLNLQFEQQDENTQGWLAFKELTTGQQFKRGPIVQRVRSASPEIGITINGSNGYTWSDGYLSGDLVLTYNSPTNTARSLDPTLTELYGARQEDYNGIPYIGLPSQNFLSGVSFRLDVPTIGLSGTFNMTFNAWIYSSVAGTFPMGGLSVTFTIIRAVTAAASKLLSSPTNVITVTGKALSMTPNNTMTANGYRLALCSDLDSNVIQPGDQVHVRITRNDAVYAGTIGIMRAWGEITQV